ncbi:MAG: N-acetyltransferase [Candidatus Omnitrophica bacterium CG11_big_fil_rev_8_21_14_0_20_64_10]|nr:MAG: N-acetyltransferase [Candidatus Omnitrophica bacterium CG11_big_fil_rev_8_21_14_0_20_64_10]
MSAAAQVHPTAVVDPGAQIGAGTRIWHFTHVMQGAVIGSDCILGQNVFVADGVRIGDRTKIQNNVSVYRGVTLEEEVFCGPACVFTNIEIPRSFIERKDGFQATRVGRGASIGANATILCGVTIGAYALIGAGAVVTRDVPEHGLVIGAPGRSVGWVCRCGRRLEGKPGAWRCPDCGQTYPFPAPPAAS